MSLRIPLEENKTAEISNLSIDSASRIVLTLRLVELECTTQYAMDVSDYDQWAKNNPAKTLIDYVSSKLLPVYNAYKIVDDLKKSLESL